MWRGPFAYGQATATRIFLGGLVEVTRANDMEWPERDPRGAESGDAPGPGGKEEQERTGAERPPPRPVRGLRTCVRASREPHALIRRSDVGRRRGDAQVEGTIAARTPCHPPALDGE
jgi:hypothetical protein